MTARVLCLLILAFSVFAASAQREPVGQPRFQAIGDNSAISDGVVTALAQDEAGLIWIGTTVGLVRYDGYQLKPFRVGEGGGQRLAGTSFVRSILAAPGGQVWVGLEKDGLALLDTVRNRWTLYRAAPAAPGGLPNGSVRALARDTDGRLWVGTIGGGLASLDAGATVFKHHRRAQGALPDDRIQSLLVDSRGDLWAGTWSGLVRRKRGSETFEPVFSDAAPADGLAGKTISMLGETPGGQIWVGTRQGELAIVDPGTGSGRWMHDTSGSGGVKGAPVLTMVAAGKEVVWVGRANGVELRSARDGKLLQHLQRDLRKPWGLAGNNVAALLCDRSGGLWVGSYGGGLQRHNPGAGLWVRRGEGPDDGVFADADVTSLLQLRGGEVWAGTNERGVAVLDSELRLVGAIRPDVPAGTGFDGGRVSSLAQTPDGTVWVGTDSKVYEYTPQRKLVRVHAAGQGRTRRMLATRDGGLWVATQDGVYRRNAGGNGFVRLVRADGKTLGGNVNALSEAEDGGVWVGGEAGLHRVAAGESVLRPVESPAGASLPDTVVLGLLLDRQKVLWVDTNAGLHRLSAWEGRQARFEHVVPRGTGPDSPTGSFGANLLADDQGRIWTHQNIYDPRDGSRVELTEADGVDIGTGWFRSYAQLADGRMLFGGSTGVLVVEPGRFVRWTYAPPIVVSETRLDGEKWAGGSLRDGLRLSPQQRSLSIEFAALDYSQPSRNRYRYRLEGFDADWVHTGAEFRVAGYGNLPPGDYTLRVQGSNRAGDWSPAMLAIPITVLPAWWQTWWARLVALLLLAGLFYMAVQLRTRLLRKQQQVLELKVRERTEALETLSLALQQKSQALEESSLTDPLTGLHNRRFLARHIEADVSLVVRRHEDHLRQHGPLGDDADLIFFLIDIDHFKQVNDRHGHSAGDVLLTQMRGRLQDVFRQADHLVRWGGEEFLIVARFTSRAHAAELAERARAVVADTPFLLDEGTSVHKTCSVGFACYPPAPEWAQVLDWAAAVDIADAALYAVKRAGRNGWLGLVSATAESEAALRAAVAQPLAEWVSGGAVQMAGSITFPTGAVVPTASGRMLT